MMWLISLALAVQGVAADRVDIPASYRGHWALDAKFCDEPGPASVRVGARTIDFYERHGFLDLAQLNEATDPATFHGSFRWVELGRFSTSAVRLEAEGGKLFITEAAEPDARRNPVGWSRCQA